MQQAELKYNSTTIKACQRSISLGLSGFMRPDPVSLSQWAEENFYLSKESSYVEGNWVAIPWQVGIMDCISHDDIQIINWIKSARVGATKIMMASVCYHAEHKPRNQLFYQPTDEDAGEFVKTELNPMFRDCTAVHRVFPHYDTQNAKNTDSLKMFTTGKLLIKGGTAARNYRRISSDIVYYDELEAFLRDIEGEGDCIKLGDKRVEGSFFKKSIRMTTPKLAQDSLIEKVAERATYYFTYQVPCPHCGDYQALEWSGMQWVDNDPETAKYQCKHCASLIDNAELPDMLEAGFWLSRCGIEIETGETLKFVNAAGVEVAVPKSVSFHIWTAYSPFVAWSVLVTEYLAAKELIRTKGDITEFKTFVNTTLGETWQDKEQAVILNEEALYNRREKFAKKGKEILVPDKALVLLGGWDTQDDRIEGEIRAFGENGENWLVEFFVLYGDPANMTLWDQLEKRVLKTYQKVSGEPMTLTRVCLDSGGHFTDEVYKFCKRFSGQRVIPTKGASVYDQPVAVLNPRRNSKGVKLAIIGTDTAKDVIYNWLQITCREEDEKQSTEIVDNLAYENAGYCHHPISDFTSRSYFKQLCSETKALKKYKGRMRWIYDNNGKRNEAIDCFVGTLAALRLSEDYFGLDLSVLANPEIVQASFSDAAKKLSKQ